VLALFRSGIARYEGKGTVSVREAVPQPNHTGAPGFVATGDAVPGPVIPVPLFPAHRGLSRNSSFRSTRSAGLVSRTLSMLEW